MFKVALKSLLGHKLRMALTVFSIVIGVSFISGTYIFTDSMSKTFEGVFEDAYAGVDLSVRAVQPEFGVGSSNIPSELVDTLKSVDEVNIIEPEVSGIAQLIDTEGKLIGGQGPPTLGFSWVETPELNPTRLTDVSRAPTAPGEIVIDVNTADIASLSIGDKVLVQSTGPVEEFEIVGFVTFGEANTLAGATLAIFEFSEAQRLFGLGDEISLINMTADPGVSTENLRTAVEEVLDDGYEAITQADQISESRKELDEGLGFITTALLAFAGISIFVGSFIIQNTFRIIVAQRSKELALLRSIGSTRGQVINLVVYEALLVSAFASILGILTGVLLSNGLRALSNAIGLGLPLGELVLESRTIYVSMAVGVIVTVVSALMPAIKASRVSPVEAMSDNEAAAPKRSLQKRTLGGLIITGIGSLALFAGLFMSVENPLAWVGFGAGVVFIGVATLAPLLSKPLANVIGYPVSLRYGLVGNIARGNTKRTPRRTASTAAALMIGVSLVTLVTIFASSIKVTVDEVIDGNFPGDIIVSSKLQNVDPFTATFPSTVADDLDKLEEVEQVTRIKFDLVKIDGNEDYLAVIEPETFNNAVAIKPTNEYRDLEINSVYIFDKKLDDLGLSIGDTFEIEFAKTGVQELLVSGSFSETYDSQYLISAETYAANSFANSDQDLQVVVNVAGNTKVEDAMVAIREELKAYPVVQAQDKGELITQAREDIDQFLALMSSLLGFAVIIAVLGITNTLTLSVTERTREIGMLRAVGMTRKQIRKMIRAEAIIIAVFGAILGVVLGVVLGWALLQALEDIGLEAFSLPYGQIVYYLVLSAFAGVIAAILPSYKASRMNILDAINYQ